MASSSPRIAAVIVAYNNPTGVARLLENIRRQTRPFDEIVIVDNSTTKKTQDYIGTLGYSVTYIANPANTGSAGGFAAGIDYALQHQHDFVYTLDDDITVYPDTLEELVKALPLFSSVKLGVLRSMRGESVSLESPVPIETFAWRGTLISCDAARAVGLPKIEYFLYADDSEYALRIHRAGYAMYFVPKSICVYNRENMKQCSLLGKRFSCYEDPFRVYYATRNSLHMYTRSFLFYDALRVIMYNGAIAISLCRSSLSDGMPHLQAMCRGMWDGLWGKLGVNHYYDR